MLGFVIFCITAVAVVGIIIFYPMWERKKLKAKLQKEFGKAPAKKSSLYLAEKYWDLYRNEFPNLMYLDNTTWNDLSMNTVFYRINYCESAVGDMFLYKTLRSPFGKEKECQTLEQHSNCFAQDNNLRLAAQVHMAQIGRVGADHLTSAAFFPDVLTLKHSWIYTILFFLPFSMLLLIPFSFSAAFLLMGGAFLLNLIVCFTTKGTKRAQFDSVSYIAASINHTKSLIKLLEPNLAELSGKMKATIQKYSSFFLYSKVLSFSNIAEKTFFDPTGFFLIPILSYTGMVKHLVSLKQETLHLLELLGEVDVAISIASYRQSLPFYCTPTFTTEKCVQVQELYHPLLEEGVPNSGKFGRCMLLTGSNASGKSTFLKSIAIGCILAQSINTCNARSFSLYPAGVFSCMAVTDSITDGDSYFIAEIKYMKRLLTLTDSDNFFYFFIDEILRGTNTIERIAAAGSVLKELSGKNCLCFAATHDIELTHMLDAEYDNYHFREQVKQNQVIFDYVLQHGPSKTRNAILLLEGLDFPTSVTKRAKELVFMFEQENHWEKA